MDCKLTSGNCSAYFTLLEETKELKEAQMYKKIVATSLLSILGTVALSTANAAERQGPPGGRNH